jgi:polysaccharide biosynthesis protein PslH
MKWLFVTKAFPWPLTHGTWLHVYHLSRTLRDLGDEVAVLTYPGDPQGENAYAAVGVRLVAGPEGVSPDRGRGRCFLSPYVFDEALAACIAREAAAFDVTVLANPHMFQYATEASSRVIADMADDPILEESRKRSGPMSLTARLRCARFIWGEVRYERQFLSNTDLVTFVSPVDAENFKLRHPQASVSVIPNGVDTDYFSRNGHGERPETCRPQVVFTGNYSHPPNEDAAVFLVQEVAPLVWRRCPQARFAIVGANPTPILRAMAGPNVTVTGQVEDLRPWLEDATAVAIPMRIGTGIKNKLLEAWAMGCAVVATPLACQGVPVQDRMNALIGVSAESLAQGLLELIEDDLLRTRLGAAGRARIERNFTWKIVATRLREAVLGLPS